MIIFWFRRDLRLNDNVGLFRALKKAQENNKVVQTLFIFDQEILTQLNNPDDQRVGFIHQTIQSLKGEIDGNGSDLFVRHGNVKQVFEKLFAEHKISSVVCNHDYEPLAIERDMMVAKICAKNGAEFLSFKDQVIFEKFEVLSDQKKPYSVFTPYKKKWLKNLVDSPVKVFKSEQGLQFLRPLISKPEILPTLKEIGFHPPTVEFPGTEVSKKLIEQYSKVRDFPAINGTSRLGLHLRFGTVSVRNLVLQALKEKDQTWLSELIWREFFMQILFHFPYVVKGSFRSEYDLIEWRNDKKEFQKWCEGKTGYPMVDAGMRELVKTGHMHNRVRMVTASFLCKHLLIHWSWGERFFAKHLLDFDLSANNGNWQWAAGTGCDAAPYFRVFNPQAQQEKFDPDLKYIKHWVPEFETNQYPSPMVEHSEARERAIKVYKAGLEKSK